MRGVFNLVLDAKGKKVVESESHDLRTGEGGLLKRDGVSGREKRGGEVARITISGDCGEGREEVLLRSEIFYVGLYEYFLNFAK